MFTQPLLGPADTVIKMAQRRSVILHVQGQATRDSLVGAPFSECRVHAVSSSQEVRDALGGERLVAAVVDMTAPGARAAVELVRGHLSPMAIVCVAGPRPPRFPRVWGIVVCSIDAVDERLKIVASHLRMKNLICDERLEATLEEFAVAKPLSPRYDQALGLFLINQTPPRIAREPRGKPQRLRPSAGSHPSKAREDDISAVALAVRAGARSKREA